MNMFPTEIFETALKHTVDAVVITDMESTIRYVNPAYTVITGYTFEEVVGQKPSKIKSPYTTQETYEQMWSVILSGGWWRGEVVNLKKSGEEFTSYLSISQVREESGTPLAYIGIFRDITERKHMEDKLHEMSLEAIYMLALAAEAKDSTTGSHLQRVRHYSEVIALQLGLSPVAADEIGYSSIMHDVGKLYVPDMILKKPGKLTPEEWKEMKRHPENGVLILREKPFYTVAREVAGNHHERWNGSGYPLGKRGEEIPLSSRIVAVADVFDALTTSRSYKNAWSDEVARNKIVEERGTSFDPKVVDAFLALFNEGKITEILRRFPPEPGES